IQTRRQSYVGVTRTGVTVVAYHTIRNEISCSGRDVVEAHRAHRLDGFDSQRRVALDRSPVDVQLATDRRIDQVKETQMLPEPSDEPHHFDRLGADADRLLNRKSKAELPQTPGNPVDDPRIRIADSQDYAAQIGR